MLNLKTCYALAIAALVAWLAPPPEAHAQKGETTRHTLSGYIKDSTSAEALLGAVVYVQELKTGTTANNYGFYSITLPEGTYHIVFSFIGFANRTVEVDLHKNRTLDLELPPQGQQLSEVVISQEREQREENVKAVQMSVAKMSIREVKGIPPLLGEVDLVRAVQLLPGVTTVGEGSSGFNVRGGSVDHNLILLDEAPVYNSSHLLGIFSIFNPDAVRDVKLYKGGIPAAYGGRLASLLDVRMKEGNAKKFTGSGGIGTIMSRLSLEGPLVKDKASFVVAARRSYIDVLAKPFLNKNLSGSKFYFYDLSGKVNWKIDAKNSVFLSGYFGNDVYGISNLFGFNYGNATGTLRWNHVFSQKLFANATVIRSNYVYGLQSNVPAQEFEWNSNIKTWQGKYDLTHYLTPDLTLSYGVGAIHYKFVPGTVTGGGSSVFSNLHLPDQESAEFSAYAAAEQKFGSRLTLQYGLRFSAYDYLGNRDTVFSYTREPGKRGTVSGTDLGFLGKTGSQKAYFNPEPRLAVNYNLNDRSSIKASYMRTVQYIHLISNTTSVTPFDVWAPSTRNVLPQRQDQVAAGYFRNFGPESDYEFSAEVYYKWLYDQVDYVDGAQLLLNRRLESELLRGKGRAYGLELYLKKNTGRLTGWVSYTYSRTQRQVDGINYDKWYSAKFDRPHNLVIVGSYKYNDKWSFGGTFTYITGTPTTLPVGKASAGGYIYPIVDGRNNSRVPDYHRLDISATLKRPKRKYYQGEWVFSVYNVYARRNAFGVYAKPGDTFATQGTTEMHRIAIFGSFIPGVTYNFNF